MTLQCIKQKLSTILLTESLHPIFKLKRKCILESCVQKHVLMKLTQIQTHTHTQAHMYTCTHACTHTHTDSALASLEMLIWRHWYQCWECHATTGLGNIWSETESNQTWSHHMFSQLLHGTSAQHTCSKTGNNNKPAKTLSWRTDDQIKLVITTNQRRPSLEEQTK